MTGSDLDPTAAIPGADDAKVVRRARISLSATFWTLGATAGLWFVHIPLIADRHGLVLLGAGIHSEPALLLLEPPVLGIDRRLLLLEQLTLLAAPA